ncbi:MAG: lipase family protein [Treponema sp.]|nr:lipase family protein [Treponema sp.]
MKKSLVSIFFVAFVCAVAFAQKVTIDVEGREAEKDALVPVTVEWNDAWFEPFAQPKYNHKLARAAGILSSLAYDAHDKTPDNALAKAYAKYGVAYDKIEWHYDMDYSDTVYGINQTAFSLARKKLPSGRDLVFVVIRGTPGNEEEWLSNINVWNDYSTNGKSKQTQYHEGFYKAVARVMEALNGYAQKNNLDLKQTPILVTGHSRGAASANLLSALLVDAQIASPDRVFAYTYATPNVTTREDAHDEKYNYIFNILNGEDIVPTVPIYQRKWRFTKFGITKAIVNSWTCDSLEEYQNDFVPKMNSLYKKLLGRDYYPFNTGTFIPTKMGDSLATINPSVKKFYKSWFPLHKRLSKTIIKQFPSAEERKRDEAWGMATKGHDDSLTGLKRLFYTIKKKADTKTQVLIEYSLHAFIDMHAMQSYLSWLMALDEKDLFTSRQSTIVRIKGVFNGAVVDDKGKIYAHIYDGVLHIRETKAPLAAWQIPLGNFGPISIGFPYSEKYSLLIYRDSLVPTPIRITIDRYDSDGTFLGQISKKCAGPHLGTVYSFDVGKEALAKVDGSPASYKKLKKLDAKIAIKDGKLKNTDVSHMSFETHIDTDRFWEFGMTSGLQKFYLALLFGFDTKEPVSRQMFSMGVGTQHCFCGPIMLNAEAYARFAHYKPENAVDEWRFTLVPATRFMFSVKPAKRIQLFTALEMNFNFSELNNDLFTNGGYRTGGMSPWKINSSLSIEPSIQFGVKL